MALSGPEDLASIATHVQDCLNSFHDACTALAKAELRIRSKVPPGTIHDCLGRFRLWVGNIGAHRRGRGSLDYKLREASHIRSRVLELLQNLKSVLWEALEIIRGERVPWEDLSDSESDESDEESQLPEEEPTTELAQLASNMAEINTCLMRLSLAIRNPAPHDQFKESSQINVTHYETFDVQHVRGKFPRAQEYLVLRLGKAISRRRQYLRYREEHRKKLEKGLKPQPATEEVATVPQITHTVTAPSEKIDSTVASSIPLAIKESVSSINLDEEDYYEDTLSQTSYASSNNDPSRFRPPPLPEEGQDGDPFECPLCFRFTSVRQVTAWHKHVYRDLQPYVCTFDGCKIPDRTYESRHEWFQHELQAHRKWWECIDGCNKTFTSADQFQRHLSDEHKELSDDERASDLMRNCERQEPMDAKAECQLCYLELPSLTQLRRHLGKHHEELSLFALPSHMKDDEEEDDAGHSEDGSQSSVAGSTRSIAPAHATCGICGMKFSGEYAKRENDLSMHMLDAHEELPDLQIVGPISDEGLVEYFGQLVKFHADTGENGLENARFDIDNHQPTLFEILQGINSAGQLHTRGQDSYDWRDIGYALRHKTRLSVDGADLVKKLFFSYKVSFDERVKTNSQEPQSIKLRGAVALSSDDYSLNIMRSGRLQLTNADWHYDCHGKSIKMTLANVNHFAALRIGYLELELNAYHTRSGDEDWKLVIETGLVHVRIHATEDFVTAYEHACRRIPDKRMAHNMSPVEALQFQQALSREATKDLADSIQKTSGIIYNVEVESGPADGIRGSMQAAMRIGPLSVVFSHTSVRTVDWVIRREDILRYRRSSPSTVEVIVEKIIAMEEDAGEEVFGYQTIRLTPSDADDVPKIVDVFETYIAWNVGGRAESQSSPAATGENPDSTGQSNVDEWVGTSQHHSTRLSDIASEDERSTTGDTLIVANPSRSATPSEPGEEDERSRSSSDEKDEVKTIDDEQIGYKVKVIWEQASAARLSVVGDVLSLRIIDSRRFIWDSQYSDIQDCAFDSDDAITLFGLRNFTTHQSATVRLEALDKSETEKIKAMILRYLDARSTRKVTAQGQVGLRSEDDAQSASSPIAIPASKRSLTLEVPTSDERREGEQDQPNDVPQEYYLDTYPPPSDDFGLIYPVRLTEGGRKQPYHAELYIRSTHVLISSNSEGSATSNWFTYYKNMTHLKIDKLEHFHLHCFIGQVTSSAEGSVTEVLRKELVITPRIPEQAADIWQRLEDGRRRWQTHTPQEAQGELSSLPAETKEQSVPTPNTVVRAPILPIREAMVTKAQFKGIPNIKATSWINLQLSDGNLLFWEAPPPGQSIQTMRIWHGNVKDVYLVGKRVHVNGWMEHPFRSAKFTILLMKFRTADEATKVFDELRTARENSGLDPANMGRLFVAPPWLKTGGLESTWDDFDAASQWHAAGLAAESNQLTSRMDDEFAFTVRGITEPETTVYVSFNGQDLLLRKPDRGSFPWRVPVSTMEELHVSGRILSFRSKSSENHSRLTAANEEEAAKVFGLLTDSLVPEQPQITTHNQSEDEPDSPSLIASQAANPMEDEDWSAITTLDATPTGQLLAVDVGRKGDNPATVSFTSTTLQITYLRDTTEKTRTFQSWLVLGGTSSIDLLVDGNDDEPRRLTITPRNFEASWLVPRLETLEARGPSTPPEETGEILSSISAQARISETSEAEGVEPYEQDEDVPSIFKVKWAANLPPNTPITEAAHAPATLTVLTVGLRVQSDGPGVHPRWRDLTLEYSHITSVDWKRKTEIEIGHDDTVFDGGKSAKIGVCTESELDAAHIMNAILGARNALPTSEQHKFLDTSATSSDNRDMDVEQPGNAVHAAETDALSLDADDETTVLYANIQVSVANVAKLGPVRTTLKVTAHELQFHYSTTPLLQFYMEYRDVRNVRIDGATVRVVGELELDTDFEDPGHLGNRDVSFEACDAALADEIGQVIQRRLKIAKMREIYTRPPLADYVVKGPVADDTILGPSSLDTLASGSVTKPTQPGSTVSDELIATNQYSSSLSAPGEDREPSSPSVEITDTPIFSRKTQAYFAADGQMDQFEPHLLVEARIIMLPTVLILEATRSEKWEYHDICHSEIRGEDFTIEGLWSTFFTRFANKSDAETFAKELERIRPELLDSKSHMGPTSYWTITELRDFDTHIAQFGTDWQAIARQLGTKTHTMVKNHFLRLIEQGQSEYEEIAREADIKRARQWIQSVSSRSDSPGESRSSTTEEPELDNSDNSQPGNGRRGARTHEYDPRISWMFAAHQQGQPEGDQVQASEPDNGEQPSTLQVDTDVSNDRWAQIRKNAAEREAKLKEGKSVGRSGQGQNPDDDETSGEETIESRVARIKTRVAELTGQTEGQPEAIPDPTVPDGYFDRIADNWMTIATDISRVRGDLVALRFKDLLKEKGWYNLPKASIEKMEAYNANFKLAILQHVELNGVTHEEVARVNARALTASDRARIVREADKTRHQDEASVPPTSSYHFAHSQTPSPRLFTELGADGRYKVLFSARCLVQFNKPLQDFDDGYPCFTYGRDNVFDVLGTKGERWLARRKDDPTGPIGWIRAKDCVLENSTVGSTGNEEDANTSGQLPDVEPTTSPSEPPDTLYVASSSMVITKGLQLLDHLRSVRAKDGRLIATSFFALPEYIENLVDKKMRVKKIMPGSLCSFEVRLKSGFYGDLALVAKDLGFVLDVSARRIDPGLTASQDAEHLQREADAWMRAHNPGHLDVGDWRSVADEAAESDRQSDFRNPGFGSKSILEDHGTPPSRDENWSTIGEGDEQPGEDDQDDSDGGITTVGLEKRTSQKPAINDHEVLNTSLDANKLPPPHTSPIDPSDRQFSDGTDLPLHRRSLMLAMRHGTASGVVDQEAVRERLIDASIDLQQPDTSTAPQAGDETAIPKPDIGSISTAQKTTMIQRQNKSPSAHATGNSIAASSADMADKQRGLEENTRGEPSTTESEQRTQDQGPTEVQREPAARPIRLFPDTRARELIENRRRALGLPNTVPAATNPFRVKQQPEQESRVRRYKWRCCQCGGNNDYALDPGCRYSDLSGYCGHWVEGCENCAVEEYTAHETTELVQVEDETPPELVNNAGVGLRGNPWAAFVHARGGLRSRSSHQVLRKQSSVETLRAASSRQVLRKQSSVETLRAASSRENLRDRANAL